MPRKPKSQKHDIRGRSEGGPSYVQLHRWFLDCPAWRAATVYERCLYLEIKRRYNGSNNGAISLSYREAEALLGCSNKPIPAAFKGLQEKGLVKVQQRGAFKGVPLATTWILTELPQDFPVRHLSPTKEFMSWQPAAANKSPHVESVPTTRPERAADVVTARWERAVSTPRAHRQGSIQADSSTLKAGTYNLPCTTYADPTTDQAIVHPKVKGRAA